VSLFHLGSPPFSENSDHQKTQISPVQFLGRTSIATRLRKQRVVRQSKELKTQLTDTQATQIRESSIKPCIESADHFGNQQLEVLYFHRHFVLRNNRPTPTISVFAINNSWSYPSKCALYRGYLPRFRSPHGRRYYISNPRSLSQSIAVLSR
jgi:hypothetical protein